jgi:putative intracellular protease/amidase
MLDINRGSARSSYEQEEKTDMKILMVLTSHSELGNTGKHTGFWLEELAAPYFVFRDAGADITLASPQGGQPPLDPKSEEPGSQTEATKRFKRDGDAQAALATTVKLSTVGAEDFDAVFYPGGHGPLWDLTEDRQSIMLIESMLAAGKPVALVCHAPGALRNVKAQDGSPLVKGKRVTGFANTEEQAVQLTKVVPFLVEDELKRLGGLYAKGPDWASFLQVDGNLITGQNPASSSAVAQQQLKMLAIEQSGAATRSS